MTIDNTDEPTVEPVVEAAEQIVAECANLVERFEPRFRRFTRALHDLGLTGILGTGWAELHPIDGDPTDVIVRFDDIDPGKFDKLTRHLEDIAELVPQLADTEEQLAEQSQLLQIAEAQVVVNSAYSVN